MSTGGTTSFAPLRIPAKIQAQNYHVTRFRFWAASQKFVLKVSIETPPQTNLVVDLIFLAEVASFQ